MPETALTLFVDLEQGSRIDLEVAARASIAWVELLRTVGQEVDPFVEWHVELESSLPGSLRIRSILGVADGAEMRGVIKGAVISAILFLAANAAVWEEGKILDHLAGPDSPAQVHALSPDELKQLAHEIYLQMKSDGGRQQARKVYDALGKDHKVRGAGVTSSASHRPDIIIPRDQFPSMLAGTPEAVQEERVSTETVELTLIRPILTSDTSRRWGFQSAYGAFGAPIHDQKFLASLAQGGLGVPLVQGIRMLVEIEITERLEGQVWRPTDRVVTKVLKIVPPPHQEAFDLESPQ